MLETLKNFYIAYPNAIYSFIGFAVFKLLSDCTKRGDDSGAHSMFSFAEFICALWFLIEMANAFDKGW